MKNLLLVAAMAATFVACDQPGGPSGSQSNQNYNRTGTQTGTGTDSSNYNRTQNQPTGAGTDYNRPDAQTGTDTFNFNRENMERLRGAIESGVKSARERFMETDQDRALVARIRLAINSDNSLSPNARNIAVQALNGVITLSGFVSNQSEKNAIENKVNDIDGVSRIDDRLEVRNTGSSY